MINKVILSEVEPYTQSNYDNYGWKDIKWDDVSFDNNYSPLTKIKQHLINLSSQYGLGDVSFKPKNKNDWDSIDSFYINAPENWSYEKISKIWDEIIESTVKFAEEEGIILTLNSLSIIVK